MHVGCAATTKFNRKDFAMTYTTPIPSGGVVVADDVTVNVTIEAVAARSASAR